MDKEKKTTTVAVFSSLDSTVPKATTWENIFAAITGGEMAATTALYRHLAAQRHQAEADGNDNEAENLKKQMSKLKRSAPAFIASVELEGGRSAKCIRGYTGYIMVDLDHIPAAKFNEAEKAVKADPHAVLAYVTLSGRGLRVIARVDKEVNAGNFGCAWIGVNEYFARMAGTAFDRQCSNATRMSCLSHDANAVFRPDAQPLPVMETGRKGRPVSVGRAASAARRAVDREGIRYSEGTHNSYVSRCIYWMNRFGIAADSTLAWALNEFADYNRTNGNPLPTMVRSIYSNHLDEHASCRPKGSGGKATANPGKASFAEIEQWLAERYEFRRNTISHLVEFKEVNIPKTVFGELSDAAENSIWCEMQRSGLNTDLTTLRTLFTSDYARECNPLAEYLDSLPPWDGVTDHVGRFLAMVHCRDTTPETFDFYIRRWLVAMIAGVLDDKVVNQEIFVLLGRQGTFKTSFMNNILPPCLRCYYCIKNNSQRMTKDDAFALTENILINMEEIDSMAQQEVNQLKAMASQPYVKDRPAYGRNKVRLPHIASFCATGNNMQFLTDSTGNRRWLVFEVDHIDNPWIATVDYGGMYAQLKHLHDSGFRYWFDDREIATLNKRNRNFEVPDQAREMIVTHYRLPLPNETAMYLTSSQIVARFGPQVRLSTVCVGRVMSALGFEQIRTPHGRKRPKMTQRLYLRAFCKARKFHF